MAGSDEHKKIAVDFLQMVVSGRIDEAYKKYVDMDGKHHNPYFAAGLTELQKAMKENDAQFPDKKHTVKHALADGDLVAVHGHLVMKAGEPGMIVVHLFRFQGGKIVEFWDCGQVLAADSPNKDGAF